ncbi:MAG: terminase TerL endonuclease subunit [Actinomycetota bacterium]
MSRRNLGVLMEGGPWEDYSGSIASQTMEFIESFCILPETREPFELLPFQRDLIEEWTAPDVKVSATVIGAGAGKTSLLGAVCTAHLFLTDEAAVPVIADTVGQAWETTLGKIARYVELHEDLNARTTVLEGQGSRQGVYHPYRHGRAWAVADKPSRLYGLNPSLAVLEEMGVASIPTLAALTNRLGKRDGARLIGIGHPSFVEDNALLHLQRLADAGELPEGMTVRQYVSHQKDRTDESGWIDSNPGLPFGLPDIDAIRLDLALPEQEFRRVRLCQPPQGHAACWLNADDDDESADGYEVWKRAEIPHAFDEDAPTWLGVDVSKSFDHTAIVTAQFRPGDRLHVKAKIFTPTTDATIDLDEVGEYIRQQCNRYDVQAVWFDPACFHTAPVLAVDLPMVEVTQSRQRMAPLVGRTYLALREGRITHDEDRPFTTHVLAAKRHYGSDNYGWTLEKERRSGVKIDAAIALVLAHGAATDEPETEPDWKDFNVR